MSDLNVQVNIEEEAYQKIMHWIRKAGSYEVSGLGNVIYDHATKTFTVDEVYLLKQENSGTETDISAEAVGKLMFEHHKSKKKGELRFWWHSHANMDVFWSRTDLDTIAQLAEGGWFLNTVFNAKEEMLSSFYMTDPMISFADELETFIMEQADAETIKKALAKLGLQAKSDKSMAAILWNTESIIPEKKTKEWDAEYEAKVTEKKYMPKATTRVNASFGLGFGMGTYDPSIGNDDEDTGLRSVPGAFGVPDFESAPKFESIEDMDEEDMSELMEDLDDLKTTYPHITPQEVVEMFIGEYPFIEEIVAKAKRRG